MIHHGDYIYKNDVRSVDVKTIMFDTALSKDTDEVPFGSLIEQFLEGTRFKYIEYQFDKKQMILESAGARTAIPFECGYHIVKDDMKNIYIATSDNAKKYLIRKADVFNVSVDNFCNIVYSNVKGNSNISRILPRSYGISDTVESVHATLNTLINNTEINKHPLSCLISNNNDFFLLKYNRLNQSTHFSIGATLSKVSSLIADKAMNGFDISCPLLELERDSAYASSVRHSLPIKITTNTSESVTTYWLNENMCLMVTFKNGRVYVVHDTMDNVSTELKRLHEDVYNTIPVPEMYVTPSKVNAAGIINASNVTHTHADASQKQDTTADTTRFKCVEFHSTEMYSDKKSFTSINSKMAKELIETFPTIRILFVNDANTNDVYIKVRFVDRKTDENAAIKIRSALHNQLASYIDNSAGIIDMFYYEKDSRMIVLDATKRYVLKVDNWLRIQRSSGIREQLSVVTDAEFDVLTALSNNDTAKKSESNNTGKYSLSMLERENKLDMVQHCLGVLGLRLYAAYGNCDSTELFISKKPTDK